MADSDPNRMRAALLKRLGDIRTASDSTTGDRRPVELDQTSVGRLSRMDAMQMQAMAQASERKRAQEVERIKAALRRLDDGDFGYCVACGEEIAPRRLEADPTVPTCIRCASGGAP